MQMDLEQIKEILPHRYPFLLVDKIIEMKPGKWATGIKCVSGNEPFFQGHFPGYPVMPGVLILEALAQTGAVAILSEEENRGKLAMFGGVKNCRFRQEVKPGDVLELHCTILSRRGNIGFGEVTAKTEAGIACQGTISFVIK